MATARLSIVLFFAACDGMCYACSRCVTKPFLSRKNVKTSISLLWIGEKCLYLQRRRITGNVRTSRERNDGGTALLCVGEG